MKYSANSVWENSDGYDIAVIGAGHAGCEAALMVDISDCHAMYLAGEKRELAFLDVRCFGTTEFVNKRAFTEAAFQAVERVTELPEDAIYLTYSEFANWGTRGSMK